MRPVTFYLLKINSFRIYLNVTFSKNTRKYSVKLLLVKYKLSFCDALHQCFAYTLMQRKFLVTSCFWKKHFKNWKRMTTTTFQERKFPPTKHSLIFIYNTLALENFNLVVTKAKFYIKKKWNYRCMKSKSLIYQKHCVVA